MLRILLKLGAAILVVCVNALHSQAATITAASTAQKDVAAAIASAQDGDTVQIPAGDSTWSSTVTITKAITLKGAGASSTFLRRHAGILVLTPTHDLPMRVTGICFDLSPFSESDGDRPAIYLGATCTNLRIDHSYFLNGQRTVYLWGKGYGVTDNCTFLNSNISIAPEMAGSNFGATSWAEPIHPGGTDTMVVEDCKFIADASMPEDPNEPMYGINGGRCCFRHNTIDYSATGRPLAAIDAHGYSNSWGLGTRFYEVYNNTFHCKYTYRFCYLRGGTHIFHDNTFIMDNPGTPAVFSLTREQGAATQELITQSFFWNNTFNGSPVGAADAGTYSGEPVLNKDFFNRAMQSGDAFYSYKPLVYPHPRVTAEDTGKPSSVANLRVIASGS
jgi:hypothetical protein